MKRRRRSTDPNGALTPMMLQILLVLIEGEQHGYAILQEIESRNGAAFEIGTATLYRTIKRLVDAELIEETESDDDAHAQRRHYGITEAGRERAAVEAHRMAGIVRWARAADLLGSEPS